MKKLKQFEFAIEKIKEAKERGLSMDDLLKELELEMPKYMPVNGKTLFDK